MSAMASEITLTKASNEEMFPFDDVIMYRDPWRVVSHDQCHNVYIFYEVTFTNP